MNLTIKPINLLLENSVQNSIGHEQYGLFAALNALAFLFIVLLDLGVNQFLTKKFAAEPNYAPDVFSTYFSFKFVLAAAYPFFMVVVGYLIGYHTDEIILLFLISLSYSFYQLLMYIRAKFQASQRFTIDSLASVSDKTFLILGTVALFTWGITLSNYIQLRVWVMLLSLCVFVIPAIKLYSSKSFSFEWNLSAWKEIVKQTYPFALITVLFSLHDKIDQVMIERMLGEHASGLYAGAYRWMDAFMMFLWIILPMFFARFAFFKNNPGDLSKIITMSQIVSGIPMIFISCFVWFYGEQLFFLLGNSTPAEIAEMTACLKILFIAVFIHAFFAAFGTLLSATGGEYFINKMLIGSIVINVVLNVVLLPWLGISGAAVATVISNIFISGSYVYFILHQKHAPLNYSITLKLLLLAAITIISFYTAYHFDLVWWLASTITGIVMLFFSLALNLHKFIHKF